jgi:Response regulator containing CheY-like receiver, AAA-type ATPase, and DNA-binding domains
MNRILLVDDEANILAALRREIMAWGGGEVEVQAYTSPKEALEWAKIVAYDLVISDYKMPEMDGVAFLKAFRDLQPDAMRLVLSGQADRDALVDAINQTRIYRFIGKPWNETELAGAIAQALAYRRVVLEHRRLAEACRERFGDAVALDRDGGHYQVLLVDDDPNVLSAVWRELSHQSRFQGLYTALRHEATPDFSLTDHAFHFTVDTSVSPAEALEKAGKVAYDLVIADYRMPGMDGIGFLEAFRRILPDAARILFSGFADMKVLIDAVNRAEIFSFVGKPWNEYDLKSAVTQAIAYRNLLLENRRLAEMLGEAAGRPVSP